MIEKLYEPDRFSHTVTPMPISNDFKVNELIDTVNQLTERVEKLEKNNNYTTITHVPSINRVYVGDNIPEGKPVTHEFKSECKHNYHLVGCVDDDFIEIKPQKAKKCDD